jgi:hypothetical protein
MIKASRCRHCFFQRIFARMAKRRMPHVVGQAQRLGQILIQPQGAGNRPTNLRDFEAVGQANPEMIAVWRDKHLRLVTEAAEGNRMDDPVPVALECRPWSACTTVRFHVQTAKAAFGLTGIGGYHGCFPIRNGQARPAPAPLARTQPCNFLTGFAGEGCC